MTDERLTHAQMLLTRAQEALPRLNYYGIGVDGEARTRREKGDAFMDRQLADWRAEMAKHLDQIAICADWLGEVESVKTPQFGSYSCKHRVERWCRTKGKCQYISNGSFIAAAVGLGFSYEPIQGTPNVAFGFSKRSIHKLELDKQKFWASGDPRRENTLEKR